MKGTATTILILFFAYGCMQDWFLKSSPSRALPSLWETDHGMIDYQDEITGEKSRITKLWAQEAGGSPESKELLREMEQRGFLFNSSKIGIFDVGFDAKGTMLARLNPQVKEDLKRVRHDSHGTHVANLIASDSPVGMSSKGVITMIHAGLSEEEIRKRIDNTGTMPTIASIDRQSDLSSFIRAADEANLNHPDVINFSMGTSFSEIEFKSGSNVVAAVDKVIDNTILVQAAGNDFPEAVEGLIAGRGDKMIIVGSADPSGFVSSFSQADKRVHILAHSDNFISSYGVDGVLEKFGGTSGAAPQVSGAVADFVSILSSPTRDEVAHVLQKSAITTGATKVSSLNGAGTLNQYKMLRVAKRMAEKGWPENRAMLFTDEIYDFTDEAKQLVDEATTLIDSTNDVDYASGFKKLRQAFFLDPDNIQARSLLAKVYRNAGHYSQALFYEDPVRSLRHASSKQKILHRSNLHAKQHTKDLLKKIYQLHSKSNWGNILTGELHMLSHKSTHEEFYKAVDSMPDFYSAADVKNSTLATMEKSRSTDFLREAIEAAGSHPAAKDFSPYELSNNTRLLYLFKEYAKDTRPDVLADPRVVRVLEKHTAELDAISLQRKRNLVHQIKNNMQKLKIDENIHTKLEKDIVIELIRNSDLLEDSSVRQAVAENKTFLQRMAEALGRSKEFTQKVLKLI